MRFNVTPEDFLKGQLVPPGIYPATVVACEPKTSKRQPNSPPEWAPSTYFEVQFKIVSPENFKGVTVYQNFSEKAPVFMVPFLEALGHPPIDRKKGAAFEFEPSKIIGKNVDISVKRGSFNNKPNNEVDGFRKYTGPAVTAAPASV